MSKIVNHSAHSIERDPPHGNAEPCTRRHICGPQVVLQRVENPLLVHCLLALDDLAWGANRPTPDRTGHLHKADSQGTRDPAKPLQIRGLRRRVSRVRILSLRPFKPRRQRPSGLSAAIRSRACGEHRRRSRHSGCPPSQDDAAEGAPPSPIARQLQSSTETRSAHCCRRRPTLHWPGTASLRSFNPR